MVQLATIGKAFAILLTLSIFAIVIWAIVTAVMNTPNPVKNVKSNSLCKNCKENK